MKIKKYLPALVLLTFQLVIQIPKARADDDPGVPGGDPDVPLDGGIGILLAAGALYGFKKLKKAK